MVQRSLEALIQCAVLAFIMYSIYLFNFHVIVWLHDKGSPVTSLLPYAVLVDLGLVSICALYAYLGTGRRSRNVPCFVAPNESMLTEPYECADAKGGLAYCSKGGCNGAWKPPNTHHCSTCGVCRLEFDHHCSFIGNCVSNANIKAFLVLLLLTPISVIGAIYPFISQQTRDVCTAYATSRRSTWVWEKWWGWWGSWIFIGGPPGRYLVGTVLGYRILKLERIPQPGDTMLSQPHARMFLVVCFALLLSAFTLVLGVATLRNTLLGCTTLDTLAKGRSKERYICIPSEGERSVSVHTTLKVEYPYDLGVANNWRQLRRRALFVSDNDYREFVWPKLNPVMLQRMRTDSIRGHIEGAS